MMFIVREVMIAKPGSAGKLAKMMKEKMKGYTDLYQSGKREIYRVVE